MCSSDLAKNNSPAEVARVGRDYADAMLKRYGDEKIAAIAYNMGPGRTDKWLASGADESKLPKATRGYIARLDAINASKAATAEQPTGKQAFNQTLTPEQISMVQKLNASAPSSLIDRLMGAQAAPIAAPPQAKPATPTQAKPAAPALPPSNLPSYDEAAPMINEAARIGKGIKSTLSPKELQNAANAYERAANIYPEGSYERQAYTGIQHALKPVPSMSKAVFGGAQAAPLSTTKQEIGRAHV